MTKLFPCRIVGVVGLIAALAGAGWLLQASAAERKGAAIAPKVILKDDGVGDQDDMCIWVHPTDPGRSTVITSDKGANKLFVYDLAGRTVQSVAVRKPGNIDLRYGFPLGGGKVDIVAFNQRRDDQVWVYAVDPTTRKLRRVDNGSIETSRNYGGCLYRSAKTGKFYFVAVLAVAEQHELFDDGTGKVAARMVRRWRIAYSEGAVADDEAGKLYIGEEDCGVWEIGAEPGDPTPGKLVIRVGENGLKSDVEGLTIYHMPGGEGYLLVSSQGNHTVKVYRRGGKHEFLGTFAVRGAGETDGIDVMNVGLGKAFPTGLFACHSDRSGGCPVLLTPWENIAASIEPELKTDTSWNPRKPK